MTDHMANAATYRSPDTARTLRVARSAVGATNRCRRAAKAGAAKSASMSGGTAVTGIISETRSLSATRSVRCAAASGITEIMRSRPIRAIRHASRRPCSRAAGTWTTLWRSRTEAPTIQPICGCYVLDATRTALPNNGARKPWRGAISCHRSSDAKDPK